MEEALLLCRNQPAGPQTRLSLRSCLTILARLARLGGEDARADACEQEAEAMGPLPDIALPSLARFAALNAAYATRDQLAILAAARQIWMP